MKKLLIVLLFAIKSVYADTAATFINGTGGKTVMTDILCKNQSGYIAYSQNPRGSTQFGCWWSDDTMVHITWSDGEFRSYPFRVFEMNHQVLDRMRARQNKGTM